MANRSLHTEAFKRAAAALVAERRDQGEDGTLTAIARELNVKPGTLRGWVTLYTPPPRHTVTAPSDAREEGLALLGILAHACCTAALVPADAETYRCPRCRGHRWDARTVHQAVTTAVLRHVPRYSRGRLTTLNGLPRLLHRVRVSDDGSVTGLTWRPRPHPEPATPVTATPAGIRHVLTDPSTKRTDT